LILDGRILEDAADVKVLHEHALSTRNEEDINEAQARNPGELNLGHWSKIQQDTL